MIAVWKYLNRNIKELQKTGLYQLTIVIDSQGKSIAYQNVLLHFKMCLFALQTFLKIKISDCSKNIVIFKSIFQKNRLALLIKLVSGLESNMCL